MGRRRIQGETKAGAGVRYCVPGERDRPEKSRLAGELRVRAHGRRADAQAPFHFVLASAASDEKDWCMAQRSDNKAFRHLPSVEEVLTDSRLKAQLEHWGRELLTQLVRQRLEHWRAQIRAGKLDSEGVEKQLSEGALVQELCGALERESGSGLMRAINASGVVLHTGLGRAPVHPEVAERMAEVARSYCVLEVDRWSGERNQRDGRVSQLLGRLLDAEAGIAVNNNAAAVLLCLQTFAGGKETILSRGELVEIGGSFRMPEVMKRAGTKLVEVGSTNRTRLSDYRSGISADTGLLMKVHTSNYRVVGFTEEVDEGELGKLGKEVGIATAYDLGSGLIEQDQSDLSEILGGEPDVRAAVASGVDVVCFSGDKIFGGPQAGILVGRADRIEALRSNPLYRALRLDKVTLAGLEATLEMLLNGRSEEIPSRAMMQTPLADLQAAAERIAAGISQLPGFEAEVEPGLSQPGSGSAPGVTIQSSVVRVRHSKLNAGRLHKRLHRATPPVYGRIQEDALLLDPRTLLGGEEAELLSAFRGLEL